MATNQPSSLFTTHLDIRFKILFFCRALYFTTYSQVKQYYNTVFKYESPLVHLCSAVTAGKLTLVLTIMVLTLLLSGAPAGLVTTTCTSPLWVVKTQMQLEPGKRLRASKCIMQIYSLDGVRGFYRGLTASYAGE